MRLNAIILLSAFLFFFYHPVKAQLPQVSNGAPSESFVGEVFSFKATLENAGSGEGYGPYLRVVLPPGFTYVSAGFLGTPLSTVPWSTTNIFDGSTDMVDPVSGAVIPASELVIDGHGAGSVVSVFRYPVGSVVTGGPELTATITVQMDPSVSIGVPQPVTISPAYEFGDTPTGATGPSVGLRATRSVTPILYKVSKSNNAPLGDRPPGPAWPIEFTISVNIANGQTVTDMELNDALPTNLQFVDVTSLPTGFSADPSDLFDAGSTLRTTPGGTIKLVNNTAGGITGTTNGGEVVFKYTAYITDILDDGNCTNIDIQNNASFFGTYNATVQPTVAKSSQVEATHITVVESASPSSVAPDQTVTYTLKYRVEDYAEGDNGSLEVIIPDGLTYLGQVDMPVGVTEAISGPVVGETTVTFTIPNSAMQSGTEYTIKYQVEVNQKYATDGTFAGAPILANDNFTNDVSLDYDLRDIGEGAAIGCKYDKVSTTIKVPAVEIEKTVISTGPYSPGVKVGYRLSMTIPTGDSRGIYFEDYFPLPVLDINDFDNKTDLEVRAWDGAVTAGKNENISFDVTSDMTDDPTDITFDVQKNMLRIEWPDVDQDPGGPYKIVININGTITEDPFADGLIHSNFMEAGTENTKSQSASDTKLAPIEITSPELAITKGVLSSDNSDAHATISPGGTPVNGNIYKSDAGDEITFVITVENIGGANAFDVRINDRVDPSCCSSAFTNKNVVSILDGDGNDISADFSGDLFGVAGLVMDSDASTYLRADDGSDNIGADMIIITYTAEVDVSVTPNLEIENTAYVTWAAAPGHPSKFDPLDDVATVKIQTASFTKNYTGITPTGITAGNNIVAGQEVAYEIVVALPEGTFQSVVLEDVMTPGLTYVAGSAAVSTNNPLHVSVPGFNAVATDDSGGNDNKLTFTFSDTIVNNNTDDNTAETLTITYKARAEQDAAYPSGTVLSNSAGIKWVTGDTTSTSPDLEMKEADVTVTKGISSVSSGLAALSPSPLILPVNSDATNVDAGDSIIYKITVKNTSSEAPATDVRIIDPELANQLTGYTLTSVTLDGAEIMDSLPSTDLNTGLTLPAVGGIDSYLPANEELIITYTATVEADIYPQEEITNQVTVKWKPSPDDGTDITVTDQATATVRDAELVKTIDDIKPANESGNFQEAFKAERLAYQLDITLPQGVTKNAKIVDVLDVGLGFSSITGISVSDGTYISTDKGGWNTTDITASVSGQTITIDLGDITVTGATLTESNEETITIVYEATVLDIPANVEGTKLNNNVDLRFNDPNNPGGTIVLSDAADEVTIIQPSLSITKGVAASTNLDAESTIFPVPTNDPVNGNIEDSDAGDIITFVVTLKNTSEYASAYDVKVTDLPLQAGSLDSYTMVSVKQGDEITDVAYSGTFTAGTFKLTDSIPPNTSAVGDPHIVIITYTAEVQSMVQATEVITNRSTVTWKPTATATTELTETDEATVSMQGTEISKTLTKITPNSTDSLTKTQVGETLTYQIEVLLPEGTLANAKIVDVLDNGLAYKAGTLDLTSSDAGVTYTGSTVGVSGQTLTIDLDTVQNTNTDNNPGDDKLIIIYDVLVEDIPANTPGTLLNNRVRFSYDDPNGAGSITTNKSANEVEIVAPSLIFTHGIIQTTDAGTINPTPGTTFPEDGNITAGASAGDVVTFRLTIENVSNVAASNLEITIPPISALQNYTITNIYLNDGVTTYGGGDYSGDLNTGFNFTPDLVKDDSDSDPTNTGKDVLFIEYTAKVTDVAYLSGLQTSNATLTWTSSTGTVEYGPSNDAATFTMAEPSVAKSVIDIMPVSTGTTTAQPGESIRYQVEITLPAGTARNLKLVDLVDPKMSVSQVVSVDRSNTTYLVSSIGNGFDDQSATIKDGAIISNSAGTDDRLEIAFGNVTNSNDTVGAVEKITVVYDVEIGNTVVAGDLLDNTVTISWQDAGGTTYTKTVNAPDVEIVMPDIQITKGISTTSGGGGFVGSAGPPEDRDLVNAEVDDEVTFVLTIQNVGNGKATMLNIKDPQIVGLGNYSVTSVKDGGGTDISTKFNGTVTGATSDLFGTGLEMKDTAFINEASVTGSDEIIITYTAEVTTAASLAGTLTGTSSVEWRTTTGVDASYDFGPVTDPASVTVVNPDLDKKVVGFSPGIAPGMPASKKLQAGETVTYEVKVAVPAGTSNNVEFVDILDDGLLFEDGAFVTSVDITVNTANVTTSIGGGYTAIEASAPTAITDENAGAGLVDNVLTLDFGTLTNSNTDTSETITIEYTVKVADDATGKVNNYAEWSWEDAGGTPYSVDGNASEYTVVAPDMAIVHGVSASDNLTADATLPPVPVEPIDDNISASDAGDKVTFVVTLTNSGDGTANEILLKIPKLTTLTNYNVTAITDGSGSNLTGAEQPFDGLILNDIFTATGLQMNGSLDEDDGSGNGSNIIILTYEAEVLTNVQPSEVLTSDAQLQWSASSGDDTPSSASDVATVTISSLLISKTITGINPNNAPLANQVQAGEVVTYEVTVTLPEATAKGGATNKVLVEDVMSDGLSYVSSSLTITASSGDISTNVSGSFNGAASDVNVTNDGGGTDNKISIDLGTVTNINTTDGTVETITITYKAKVNTGAAGTLSNNATVSWQDPADPAGAPLTQSDAATPVDVVAPNMQVTKGIISSTNASSTLTGGAGFPPSQNLSGAEAGDVITFQITLENLGDGSAIEVAVEDPVDPISALGSPTILSVTDGDGNPVAYTGTLAAGTFQLTNPIAADDGSITPSNTGLDVVIIRYTATVATSIQTQETVTNKAGVTWKTAPSEAAQPQVVNTASFTNGGPTFTLSINSITPGYAVPGRVHIGEIIEYAAEITLPQGVTNNLVLDNLLAEGLAFTELMSITPNGALTSSHGAWTSIVPTIANIGGGTANDARSVSIDLGDVTNADVDGDDETLTITFRAAVVNRTSNVRGTTGLDDVATLNWEDALGNPFTGTETSLGLVVAEPELQVTTSFDQPDIGDGETVNATITVEHTGLSNGTAYDISIKDILPVDLEYDGNGVTVLDQGNNPVGTVTASAGQNVTVVLDELALTDVITIKFGVKSTAMMGSCETVTNNVSIEWESLKDADQTGMPVAPYGGQNAYAIERTGNAADAGEAGVNTYNDAATANLDDEDVLAAGFNITATGDDCVGEVLTLSTTTIPGATYAWTKKNGGAVGGNSPTLTFTPLAVGDAGNYVVTVSLGTCPAVASTAYTVTVNAAPVVNADNSHDACSASGPLLLTATPVSGGGGYTFEWTGPNGFTSTDQNPVIASPDFSHEGTYTVVMTDVHGCASGSANTTVFITPEQPVITGNDPLCEDGTLSLSVPVVTGTTVTYEWIFTDDATSTSVTLAENSNELTINSLNKTNHAGNYTVSVTRDGCTSPVSAAYHVDVWEKPNLSLPDPTLTICDGSNIELAFTSTNASGTYTVLWTHATSGFSSTALNPTIPASNAAHYQSGDYTVTLTSITTPACPVSQTVSVDIDQPSKPDISAVATSICDGTTIQLSTTATCGGGYEWRSPSGNIQATVAGTPNLEITSADAEYQSGNWHVRCVTVDGCKSEWSDPVTITVKPIPAQPVLSGPSQVCVGSGLTLTTTDFGAVTYTWTLPNGTSTVTTVPSLAITATTEAAHDGNFFVKVTVDGCESLVSAAHAVAVEALPATFAPSNDGPACPGSAVQLTANIVATSYEWRDPNGNVVSTIADPIIPGASVIAGDYTLTAFNAVGCSRSGITNVALGTVPSTPVLTQTGGECEGETLTMNASTYTGTTVVYEWTFIDDATSSTTVLAETGPSLVINNVDKTSHAGKYSVRVTVDGCQSAASLDQVVNIDLVPSVTAGNTGPYCDGTDIELSATPSVVGTYTYAWSGPDGFTATTQNVSIAASSSSYKEGSYTVVITSQNGECIDQSTTTVTLNKPGMPILSAVNTSVCNGSPIELAATAGNAKYYWLAPDGNTLTTTGANAHLLTLNSGDAQYLAGSWTVKAEDASGCQSEFSATLGISLNAKPEAIATNNGPVCEGNDVTLTGNTLADANYAWYNTDPSIGSPAPISTERVAVVSGLAQGTHTFYLQTTVGTCVSDITTTTVQIDDPTASTVSIAAIGDICEGETIALSASTTGNDIVAWLWEGPDGYSSAKQNPPAIANADPNNSGTYTITVITDNGCTITDTEVVTVNPKPVQPVLTATSLEVCDGEDIELATTATGDTYYWVAPNGNVVSTNVGSLSVPQSNANYISGDWKVKVEITATNCESDYSDKVNITIKDKPIAIPTNSGPVCEGNPVTLQGNTVEGASYAWYDDNAGTPDNLVSTEQSPIIEGLTFAGSPHKYHLIITTDGCESEAVATEVIITDPNEHTLVINGEAAVCEGEEVSFSATSSTTLVSYSWSGPDGYASTAANPPVLTDVTTANAGTYSLTVQTEGGCELTTSHELTVNPKPSQPVLTATSLEVCTEESIELVTTAVADTYEWVAPNGNVVTTTTGSLTIPDGDVNYLSGEWKVKTKITATSCESDYSSPITITIKDKPVAIPSNSGPICESSDVTLFGNSVNNAGYAWYSESTTTPGTPGQLVSTNQNTSITGLTFAGSPYKYYLIITSDGCESEPVETEVTVTDPNVDILSINGETAICEGASISLSPGFTSNSGASLVSYQWTGPNGFSSTESQPPVIINATLSNAGTYYLTVGTSSGCTLSTSFDVTVNAQPTEPVLTATSLEVCTEESIELATTAVADTYEWVAPNGNVVTTTTGSLTIPDGDVNYLSGEWKVKTKITATGCESDYSEPVTIIIKDKPVAIPSNSGPICESSDVTLFGNSVNNAGYAWYSESTTTPGTPGQLVSTNQNTSIGGLAFAGSPYKYYLIITSDGCESEPVETEVVVTDPNVDLIAIDTDAAICEGASIALTPDFTSNSGATLTSYNWTGPNGFSSTESQPPVITSATLANMGTYYLTVGTSSGCTLSTSFDVTVNAQPTEPVLTATSLEVCTEESIELATTAVADTYEWVAPNGNVVTTTTGSLTIPDGNVNYLSGEWKVKTKITATSCESDYSSPITITIKDKPVAIPSNSGPICESSEVTLFGNSVNNAGYAWYAESTTTPGTPGQLVSTNQNTSIGGLTFADSPYKYYLIITSDGCESDPVETKVIVTDPNVDAIAIDTDAAICEGASIALTPDFTSNSGATLTSYNWTGPNGFSSTESQPPVIINATLSNAGTYYLTVGTSSGCTLSTSFDVTVNAQPMAPVLTATSLEVCTEESIELATTAVADNYEWVAPNGNVVTTATGSLTIPDGDVNYLSGEWKVKTKITATGCESDYSSPITITIKDKPVAIPSNSSPICESSDVTLFGNSVNNASYAWYAESTTTLGTPGQLISTNQNTIISDLSYAGSSYKYYLVITTDGCESDPVETEVTVINPESVSPPVLDKVEDKCEGAIVRLKTSTQAEEYFWVGPNGYRSDNKFPPAIEGLSEADTGFYYLTVTYDAGCTATDSVYVGMVTAPEKPLISSNSPICVTDVVLFETNEVSDVTTYVWYLPDGRVMTTSTNSLELPDAEEGEYYVVHKRGDCESEPSRVLDMKLVETVDDNAFAGIDKIACGGSIELIGNIRAGLTGRWSTSDLDPVIGHPTEAQTIVTNLLSGKTYEFVWTLENSVCGTISRDTVMVAVLPPPIANADSVESVIGEIIDIEILANDSLNAEFMNVIVVQQAQQGYASVNNDLSINYEPEAGFAGRDSLIYRLCSETCDELCDTALVIIKVELPVEVTEILTPNFDGFNDYLEITGLENFPKNNLLVFNRWGNKVFESDDYQNDWVGTYKGSPLPDGTYYYVIKDRETGESVKAGFFTIHR